MQHQVHAYLANGGEGQKDSRNRVILNGPGGVGRSEVAVARVPADFNPSYLPPSGSLHHHHHSTPPRPLTTLLQRGMQAASRLFLDRGGHGDAAGHGGSSMRLQCALLTVVLPEDVLAQTIAMG